jgi:hypothetical protein
MRRFLIDPFALMELHHIEHEKLTLLRNIDHFGCVIRATEQAKITSFVWPVRGPKFGGQSRPLNQNRKQR